MSIKVLIIGVGNPMPVFINRRLRLLSRNKINLSIVCPVGQTLDLPVVSAIKISRKLTITSFISTIIKILKNLHVFYKLIRVRSDLPLFKRLVWTAKYLPLAVAKKPDIIHLQWIAAAAEYAWLRKFFDCPIIASARGSMVTVYPLTRPGYQDVIQEAIKQADFIHCVSNDIAAACEKLGARKDQIIVNYNGIDLNHFKPISKSHSNSTFTLISVGTLMWRKAYIYQLHIVKNLLESGYPVKLIIVGDGPDREALEYTAHILGIRGQVEFTGKLSEEEMPSKLNHADVYLSTSMAEGLANSVVEAVACGLPVVGFECEGMREIIEHSVNGFVVPFGEVDELAGKIKYLLTHPEEKIQMGKASRKIAEERFNENFWVQEMIQTYKKIAGKK